MTGTVVFIQGAGSGAYDEDAPLVGSLRRELGAAFDVHYPPMPDGDDWGTAIGAAIAGVGGPLALVGHSAGGYQLLRRLAARPPVDRVLAICLIAAPFPGGDDEWTFDGFELPEGFAERLTGPVLLYASEDDDVVPFAHRDLYAAAIPGSITRTTAGGHQLGGDLREVARDILDRA